jgi:hypothetical protein
LDQLKTFVGRSLRFVVGDGARLLDRVFFL